MQPSGKLIIFKGRVFEDHYLSCAENDVPLIIEKNQLDAKDEIPNQNFLCFLKTILLIRKGGEADDRKVQSTKKPAS